MFQTFVGQNSWMPWALIWVINSTCLTVFKIIIMVAKCLPPLGYIVYSIMHNVDYVIFYLLVKINGKFKKI